MRYQTLKKIRLTCLLIVISGFGFYIYGANSTFAQAVPGDFEINCQICGGPNNDKITCIDKTTAPRVDFSWTPSSGATSYEVYYKGTSLGNWTGPIATLTGTRYSSRVPLNSQNHYYVRAINNSGFKACSINFPGSGGCKAENTEYLSGDEGVEANCVLPVTQPPSPKRLTVTIVGSGTVNSAWGNCTTQTSPCIIDLPHDTNVTLTAQAGSGQRFTSWGGDCAVYGSNPSCTGVMSIDRSAIANFGTYTYSQSAYVGYTYSQSSYVVPQLDPPPRILNVRIINVTQTSATVTWETSVPADSQLELCLTFTHCGSNTPLNSSLTTSHSVNLSGLTPKTVYFFWVRSKGGGSLGTLRVEGYYTFQTKAEATYAYSQSSYVAPPPPSSSLVVVSNVQAINITRDSATVTWDTDKPANSAVYSCFARIFCYRLLASNPSSSTAHSLNISGLRPDRNYYIKVSSLASDGGRGEASYVFRTMPGLVISNVSANAAQNAVTVSWETNFPADSRMKVCRILFFCYFIAPLMDPAHSLNHSMTISGLRPGTRYYYQVSSVAPDGFTAASAPTSIMTR